MLKNEEVENIINDLSNTTLTINEIAIKYNVSRGTVNNINSGKTHNRNNLCYPLRKTKVILTLNECAFIKELSEIFNAKQIHIILGKASYSTISTIINDNKKYPEYQSDLYLDKRLSTFMKLLEPNKNLVNNYSYNLTIQDMNYIQFLGRIGADLNAVLYAFIELIEFETSFLKYPIKTKEDLEKYLTWNGNNSQIILWIKNIYTRKIKKYKKLDINYLNIDADFFTKAYKDIDLEIVNSIINFNSKENY